MSRHSGRLLKQRLLVCVGSGGVGKTTTAAALALAASWSRRRTAVITVDPARRLKDSLGLTDLSVDPQPVPLPHGAGPLDALAVDTKRTFDALIERVAPNPEIARRIFANRLYQELSNGLGGSAEYMAMEKLHELLHLDSYQLIVVDTPPSAHAEDLLNAPVRLTEMLASSAVRVLKAPAAILGGSEAGLLGTSFKPLLTALQRWTGLDLLSDLSDFVVNFEQLIDGFRSRAQEVERALRSRTASFVMVTTPESEAVDTTIELHRELSKTRFPLAGIIANRVHQFPARPAQKGDEHPTSLGAKLRANYADFEQLSRRDARSLARLQRSTRLPFLAKVPVLERPPASLEQLGTFAELLVGEQRSKT